MYDIGEIPGIGKYQCIQYPRWVVQLDDATDRLPPCPYARQGERVKYRRIR